MALTTPYHVIGWPRLVRVDRSSYNPTWVNRWNDNLRAVATRNPGTTSIIDFNKFLCPEGKWTDSINGLTVRRFDKTHLSDEGADLAASWLAPQLVHLARAPVPTTNASVGIPPPAPSPSAGGVAARR